MLPLVPLAHAALAAGHEVAVATSGPALRAATRAGLQAIATDDGDAVEPYEELVRTVTRTSVGMTSPGPKTAAYAGSVFGEVGARMVDGLVDAAREWRADAVLYPPNHVAGLVAARATGLPAVLHGIGTPRATFGPGLEYLAPVAKRLGAGEPREADVELDLSPASLEAARHSSPTARVLPRASVPLSLPMRYLPYNGGAELPLRFVKRGEKPRVVVTLGSLATLYGEGAMLRRIVDGAADLDIEVIVTTGGTELPALRHLPDGVTPVDWLPLNAVLPTCDAVVHHGGMGSTYSAFAAGVPQLGIPLTGLESLSNAQMAVDSGAGLRLESPHRAPLTPEAVSTALRELLDNPGYRKVSLEVADEMRDMPTPSTLIGRLTSHLEEIR
ncbi:nucleotide disphospho-sugar-binding domain-containing protein [Streptomyces sp. NBC_01549]|uniref:nucleotide disphospho-sugar-binding domain-containing protein n=1 Tax=Streptomyces sp. NBC_01549 TaxID=2975874 RepID=UPI002B1CD6A5|nr:nucleotide disphospho-sugar-binding domain-containing protein [Streptomyces sp. NBC_01549]